MEQITILKFVMNIVFVEFVQCIGGWVINEAYTQYIICIVVTIPT